MKKTLLISFLFLTLLLSGCSDEYDKEDEAVLEKCADLSFKQIVQFLLAQQDKVGSYEKKGEEITKIEQGKQWTPEKEQLIDNFLETPLKDKMKHKNVPKWSSFTNAFPYKEMFEECIVLKKEDPEKFKENYEK